MREKFTPAKAYTPVRGVAWFVTELPGQGGVDWGYGFSEDKALALSDYWQRRFMSDCKATNKRAIFIPVHN